MNATLYTAYAPAIEAYLSSQTDKVCKSWTDLLHLFFTMNVDAKVSQWGDLALMFANSKHQNYFRVPVGSIEPYFERFDITKNTLRDAGFAIDIDFVNDDEDLRLTFGTFRKLIFMKGATDMVQAYEFIDKLYDIYMRYELAMMNRNKRPTHWTLLERVRGFTQSMQPHIDFALQKDPEKKPKFLIMDSQPKVYCVIKGTMKTIKARFAKLQKSEEAHKANPDEVDAPKFSYRTIVPVYESVMPSVAEEIDAVLNYIDQEYAIPHRESQLGQSGQDGEPITKLTKTKHNVRLLKTAILIDQSQQEYSSETTLVDIDEVRQRLKHGKRTHTVKVRKSKKEDPNVGNTTDIKIFERTNGKYIDEYQSIDLFPVSNDSNVVNKLETREDEIDDEDTFVEDDVEDEVLIEKKMAAVVVDDPVVVDAPIANTPVVADDPVKKTPVEAEVVADEGEYNEDDGVSLSGRTKSAVKPKTSKKSVKKSVKAVAAADGYNTSDSE